MSEFKFSCPHCQQHILCDRSCGGMQTNCPTCNTAIIVPQVTSAAGPAAPAPASPSVQANDAPKLRTGSAPSTPHIPSPTYQAGPWRHNAATLPMAGGKSWLATYFCALFLGGFGVDRFYTGRTGLGIVKLLTGGLCGVWSLIDVILLLAKKYQDSAGNTLRPAKSSHMAIALAVTVIAILLNVVIVSSALSDASTALEEIKGEMNYESQSMEEASTPTEAFARFQRAIQAKEYPTAFHYLTPQSQTALLGSTLFTISLTQEMTRTIGPGNRNQQSNAAQTQAQSVSTKVTAALKRHGLPQNPGKLDEATLARVANKGQCFADLVEASGEEDLDWGNDFAGKLTGLTTQKDTATGRVNGEIVNFRKLGNAWLLDLLGMRQ